MNQPGRGEEVKSLERGIPKRSKNQDLEGCEDWSWSMEARLAEVLGAMRRVRLETLAGDNYEKSCRH